MVGTLVGSRGYALTIACRILPKLSCVFEDSLPPSVVPLDAPEDVDVDFDLDVLKLTVNDDSLDESDGSDGGPDG